MDVADDDVGSRSIRNTPYTRAAGIIKLEAIPVINC
jgi:hypothetical protein